MPLMVRPDGHRHRPTTRPASPVVATFSRTLLALAVGVGPLACKEGKGKGKGTDDAGETDGDTDGMVGKGCVVEPFGEAFNRPGPQPDGSIVLVSGRRTTSMGPTTFIEGFAHDTVVHPLANVAFVTTADKRDRRLYVIDLDTGDVVQNIDRGDAYYGLAMSPDGSRLYASRGVPSDIEVFDVAVDGLLTSVGLVPTIGWTTGMMLDADGSTLWAAAFDRSVIAEVDTATLTETRTIDVGRDTWDLQLVESRNELWATDLLESTVAVIDLSSGSVVESIDIGRQPAMMAINGDESRVFVSLSGGDEVLAVDTATRQVIARTPVAEDDFVDDQGNPLPNSNVSALMYDADSDRLYAARGSDSAISVFDGISLDRLGSLPTNYYPTDVELSADGSTLVVAEGKASGVRGEPRRRFEGGLTRVTLADVDLADTTSEVVENYRRSLDLQDASMCESFPIPRVLGEDSPIEHVILVVKENQTFDAIFGDAGPELGVEADPDYLDWDATTTPNHRAVAKAFTIADNFYLDTVDSDTGHIFLTTTHLTELVERVWTEKDVYDAFGAYRFHPGSLTPNGNFFTWLVDHDVDIQIYGEIVGTMVDSSKGSISQFSDGSYPGGGIINYDTKDEAKARYLGELMRQGRLATFSYVSLPNDHGQGISPGKPTPESMVADNDYGVGIIIDELSHSDYWDKTVVFVLQDDPQGSDDHIDRDRSFLLVASPYARRGYVSKAQHSFNSVFATIELILGVPPMGRPDAAAGPLYDMFTDVPDMTPYDAREREFPETLATEAMPGVEATRCMDFRGPDRNPELGLVYDVVRRWRREEITKAEADAIIAAGLAAGEQAEELEEEAEEETFAFDVAWDAFVAQEVEAGRPAPDIDEWLPGLGPAEDCVRRLDAPADDD